MASLPPDHEERVAFARLSLNGLSLGDSFGECFFSPRESLTFLLDNRELPRPLWKYTDDTVMALSIVEVLEHRGYIDQDLLAQGFAQKYAADTNRGYGPGAHRILREIGDGADWREVSKAAFGGLGSLGNGGAMRAAPIGGYFKGEPETAALEAARSAEITHAHPEGIAGAMAVATAAALAPLTERGKGLIEATIAQTPDGEVRNGLQRSLDVPFAESIHNAAAALGNGTAVTAADTVPFTVWSAARHIGQFENAMWETVSALGDRDTTCAIVGGIVALSLGGDQLPSKWSESRESLGRLAKIGTHAG